MFDIRILQITTFKIRLQVSKTTGLKNLERGSCYMTKLRLQTEQSPLFIGLMVMLLAFTFVLSLYVFWGNISVQWMTFIVRWGSPKEFVVCPMTQSTPTNSVLRRVFTTLRNRNFVMYSQTSSASTNNTLTFTSLVNQKFPTFDCHLDLPLLFDLF